MDCEHLLNVSEPDAHNIIDRAKLSHSMMSSIMCSCHWQENTKEKNKEKQLEKENKGLLETQNSLSLGLNFCLSVIPNNTPFYRVDYKDS